MNVLGSRNTPDRSGSTVIFMFSACVNIGIGTGVLQSYTGGINSGSNCVIGGDGAYNLLSGAYNTIINSHASTYTSNESSNVLINTDDSTVGESHVLRIGSSYPGGSLSLAAAYIQGIYNSTITGSAVYITSAGQLGILTSSQRYKDGIMDMPDHSEIISALRPVTFTYKNQKSPKPLHYGLIAEEVEKVWPEMESPRASIRSVLARWPWAWAAARTRAGLVTETGICS